MFVPKKQFGMWLQEFWRVSLVAKKIQQKIMI